MPVISRFLGIIIAMYWNGEHEVVNWGLCERRAKRHSRPTRGPSRADIWKPEGRERISALRRRQRVGNSRLGEWRGPGTWIHLFSGV